MNLVETRLGRRILFTAYYFVEGAPIGFLWWCLPSVMRSRGVEPDEIGALLAMLTLPWATKWLWAPLVDGLQRPGWTLRAWIGAAQVGMVLTLVPLLLSDAFVSSPLLAPCLVAHALCAATQDAGIDALMVRTTPADERGRLSGWMQVGMLASRGLLGGGALLVLAEIGEGRLVLLLLAVVVAGLALLPLYRAPLPEEPTSPRRVLAALGAALRGRTTFVAVAFAVLAGAGFEAIGAFAGPLLTERTGGDTSTAGRFLLLPAIVASSLGGLAGGFLTDRTGERRGLVFAGVALFVACFATAVAVSSTATTTGALQVVLFVVYACIGWFTASSYAQFMRWTSPRLGATQFSAYMGATNLCEAWAVAAAGSLIPSLGYGWTFAGLSLVGLAALSLLALTRDRDELHATRVM